jgi:hypothetical protein
MDAWSNEVDPIDSALIIHFFHLLLPFGKANTGIYHFCGCDTILTHDAEATYKFTIVSEVLVRKDTIEQSRAYTKEPGDELA